MCFWYSSNFSVLKGTVFKILKSIILKPKVYSVLKKCVGLEGICKTLCKVLCKKDPVLVYFCHSLPLL